MQAPRQSAHIGHELVAQSSHPKPGGHGGEPPPHRWAHWPVANTQTFSPRLPPQSSWVAHEIEPGTQAATQSRHPGHELVAQKSQMNPSGHSPSAPQGATQIPVPNWQSEPPQSSWNEHPAVVVPVDDAWLDVPELWGCPDDVDGEDAVLAPEPSPPDPSSSTTTVPPHPLRRRPRPTATIT